jgi:sugar phosphate isomerase/epimerase
LNGPYIESYLDLIQRTGTEHLGFTLDLGIFCRQMPQAILDQAIRNGAQPELAAYVADAYRRDLPFQEVIDHVQSQGGTHAAVMLSYASHYFGPPRNRIQDLSKIMPYVKNVHGKFYVMTEDADEPSIPYREVLRALVDGGYAGSIDSEYEGQRLTQDAFPTDSCEQVRRHHAMMCRILAEV